MKKLKTVMKNGKANLLKLYGKVAAFATLAMMTAQTTMVRAAGENVDAKNTIGTIIDTVVKIFPFVGFFFAVSGVFKLVMAYRNDQPESQSAAAKDIVIGVVLIVFASFIWEPISAALGL